MKKKRKEKEEEKGIEEKKKEEGNRERRGGRRHKIMKDSEETRGMVDIIRDGLEALLGISDVFSKDKGPKVF